MNETESQIEELQKTISYLNSLDLTEYEAKAVLALTEKGSLEAPEISRNADIPKTRVYIVWKRKNL